MTATTKGQRTLLVKQMTSLFKQLTRGWSADDIIAVSERLDEKFNAYVLERIRKEVRR